MLTFLYLLSSVLNVWYASLLKLSWSSLMKLEMLAILVDSEFCF